MFNLDSITENNNNKDWSYRKLIIGRSGSGKTNYLLNSIQKDNNIIDKVWLYAKDLEEPKYDHLVKVRIQAGIKNLNDPTAFRKLNISLCFLTQSYFSVPKEVRLNCTHYIWFELNNKRELQNIAINHSADIANILSRFTGIVQKNHIIV